MSRTIVQGQGQSSEETKGISDIITVEKINVRMFQWQIIILHIIYRVLSQSYLKAPLSKEEHCIEIQRISQN